MTIPGPAEYRERRDGRSGGLRVLACAAAILIGLGTLHPAGADPTAETGVSVTTEDVGSFTIAFAQLADGYTFANAGGSQIAISAIEGASATAAIRLSWSDTRAEGERTGYSVQLSAGDLVSSVTQLGSSGVYTIPVGNLRLYQIGNALPLPSPPSLETPQIVFTSAEAPEAGDAELDIVLHLTIPAGMYPTTYTATLLVAVVPDGP
jgi:hypothetical protein